MNVGDDGGGRWEGGREGGRGKSMRSKNIDVSCLFIVRQVSTCAFRRDDQKVFGPCTLGYQGMKI